MSEQQAQGQEPEKKETAPAGTPDPWEAFPAEFNWVRKELEDTRKEAADKRVLARELQEKLTAAKTPEEVQKITSAHETKTAELEAALVRERVARKTGLDEDLVEFLTAKTEDELLAQAAKLARKKADAEPVVVTVQEPRGGLNPSGDHAEPNGFDEYKRWKESNRR